MVNVGDHVHAVSPIANGNGVVMYVAHYSEILPVQVELDEADASGHRIYRFRFAEVVQSNGGNAKC